MNNQCGFWPRFASNFNHIRIGRYLRCQIFVSLPGVHLDGNRESAVVDNLLSTCMTLPESYFRMRPVATFVLNKTYTNAVHVWVHGRGMQCELPARRCRRGFVISVFQQGRSKYTCAAKTSPCPEAELCAPSGMTSRDDGMATCRYRCSCPNAVDDEQIPCETILFSIGSRALSDKGDDLQICSFNMELFGWRVTNPLMVIQGYT